MTIPAIILFALGLYLAFRGVTEGSAGHMVLALVSVGTASLLVAL